MTYSTDRLYEDRLHAYLLSRCDLCYSTDDVTGRLCGRCRRRVLARTARRG